jgi:hypothetical protein
MMLRVQFERGTDISGDYRQFYGLTEERAAMLHPDAPILHPGPINRGLEIDTTVADDPSHSVVLQQVTNGVGGSHGRAGDVDRAVAASCILANCWHIMSRELA